MTMGRIPHTDSIEELARFWDTHDVTDFEAELEEVEEPVFERAGQTVMKVRLDRSQASALRRLAKSRGVPASDLVRKWVGEKLRAS